MSIKPIEEIVKAGGYTFKIIESQMKYQDKTISHTFKIGGDYENCVHLSYFYKNDTPVSAKLPHLMYEPECSIESNLARGIGSELMIKTLLRHAYKKIKSVHIFQFDDMSHIDCEEKDMTVRPPRHMKRPLHLAFFSIAYNGMTWYEKRFQATMIDKERYIRYRERLQFLTDESKKVDFLRFLEIAQPPHDQLSDLKLFYEKTKTYREFFNAIPFESRCDILLPWLETFMLYYISDVYTTAWEMDILKFNPYIGGSKTRKSRRLFPSKYRLIQHKTIHTL